MPRNMVSSVVIPHQPAKVEDGRIVVAVILEWRGKLALFKRSRSVGHDAGLWHCITGYVEAGTAPKVQAAHELLEETGLRASEVVGFCLGPVLTIADVHQRSWMVHTYVVRTLRKRLSVNYEHDSYRWIAPHKVKRFSNRVPWLDDVLDATGHLITTVPPATYSRTVSGNFKLTGGRQN